MQELGSKGNRFWTDQQWNLGFLSNGSMWETGYVRKCHCPIWPNSLTYIIGASAGVSRIALSSYVVFFHLQLLPLTREASQQGNLHILALNQTSAVLMFVGVSGTKVSYMPKAGISVERTTQIDSRKSNSFGTILQHSTTDYLLSTVTFSPYMGNILNII